MVHETGQVSGWSGVNDPVLIDGQEVEVGIVADSLVCQSSFTFFLVDDLAHVLDHELSLIYVLLRPQTPSPLHRIEGLGFDVLTFLESLIAALVTNFAVFAVAFVHHHPIQAVCF